MSRHTNSRTPKTLLSLLAVVAFVVLGASFGAAAASADDPAYSISGTISDASGNGVGGIGVVLDGSTGEVASGFSNSDGSYSFAVPVADTYTVTTDDATGYLPASGSATVSDASPGGVINLTVTRPIIVPASDSISGSVTAGGAAATGVTIAAVDSGSGHGYGAGPTDSSGGFSMTIPPSSAYVFQFSNSAGTRLAVNSYNFGNGAVSANGSCTLSPDSASRAELAAGGAISLTVTLSPDPTACATPSASTSPAARKKAAAAAKSSALAITGSAPSPTPSADPTEAPNASAPRTVTSPKTPRPLLTPTSSTASPMPFWGWLLVGLAVILMVGGVSFTVVRHR